MCSNIYDNTQLYKQSGDLRQGKGEKNLILCSIIVTNLYPCFHSIAKAFPILMLKATLLLTHLSSMPIPQ